MERLKHIKETLIGCVQAELGDIKNVDTKELGEVIDMIKDLEETIYYCNIIEAMEDKEEFHHKYKDSHTTHNGKYPIYYDEKEFPMDLRDSKEGKSPISRRMYMESKELHKDKEVKIRELDKYMKELSEDLVEMIQDASIEEKQLLEKKITALATKIASLNHA